MQQTGLPAVMVDPLQNRDFLTLIGGETAETVRQQLTAMTPDESYAEVPVKLLLNGQLRRLPFGPCFSPGRQWKRTASGVCSVR